MSQNDIQKNNEGRSISIINTIFVYVCMVSLINIVLLTFSIFYPVISLVTSFILLLTIFCICKIKINLKDNRFNWLFLLVLMVSLFLRFSPNLYITGGQDQGSYVSLSKQYEINHGLYIKDELREELSQDAKHLYDISGAATMLGVKELDKENSIFYMPFYPIFPSWMSIFSFLFGSDNRIYALTMFSILSIIGVYLFAYEITDRNKKVALLASFLVAINPLYVYFSRIPLTEIASLTFLLFSLYFLTRFYNSYKRKKIKIIYLFLSLLSANVLFYTRMSSLLFLPLIFIIPIMALFFYHEKKLIKYLTMYSSIWTISLAISYLYYYMFLPDLFNSIFEGRILVLLNSNYLLPIIIGLLVIFSISLISKNIRNLLKRIFLYLYEYSFLLFISIFTGLILYELYPYITEILMRDGFAFLSFESLSYLKQLNFIATFLYLSPIGFLLIPIAIYYFRRGKDLKRTLFVYLILGFLIYCWGVLNLTPYHYYFVRYQISELIPFCLILLSMFLVRISSVKKSLNIFSTFVIVCISIYFGYFSVIQLRDFEGADRGKFEELQSIVKKDDLLLIANNEFESSQQIVFPIKYYYGIKTFLIYTSTYIDFQEIIDLKSKYQNIYILMTNPNFEQKKIKLVKEIDFKHNYLVHCNREEDAYFKMEDSSKDIPFCKYIIIPNRYYYGTYKMYLYLWE